VSTVESNQARSDSLSQEQVKPFVLAAHWDLEQVRRMLVEEPALLDACLLEWNERPIEAAGHTGNRPIAEFLLDQGAPMNIFCAAMLGEIDKVRDYLATDSALASANGVHGISLLAHAAMSGKVELVELLAEHGNVQDPSLALPGAVTFGHIAMADWLLTQGADPDVQNWQGKSGVELATEREDDAMVQLLRQYGAEA
jgi:ankyrin repeat protein